MYGSGFVRACRLFHYIGLVSDLYLVYMCHDKQTTEWNIQNNAQTTPNNRQISTKKESTTAAAATTQKMLFKKNPTEYKHENEPNSSNNL